MQLAKLPNQNKHNKMNDITENKHGGNANSKAAFDGIYANLTLRQQQVLATIKARGSMGRTCREIADRHGCGMNAISGRLTELKAMGKIKVVGRRDGCAVYQITEP